MAYFLKKSNTDLFFVDYDSRNGGLYYRIYSETQRSRPNRLISNSTNQYTATIDSRDQIHIVVKTSKNQIIHFKETSSGFTRDVLLDDSDNHYNISNLSIVSVNETLHLFYGATNPVNRLNELIHHIISFDETVTPKAICTMPKLETPYDFYVYNGNLYLVYITNESDSYQLRMRSYIVSENKWIESSIITTSNFPITYCKFCIYKNGSIYLAYVQERYGQYQIFYKKNQGSWEEDSLLYSCAFPLRPNIFIYYDALWINWVENGTLKMILSTNWGIKFSSSQNCSLQVSNPILYGYVYPFGKEKEQLFCTQLYGVDAPIPKFSILHQIDMNQIHPTIAPNRELALYVSNLSPSQSVPLKTNTPSQLKQLQEENQALRETQENITEQYNKLAELTSQIQEEGKKWRQRYYDAEESLKAYKAQVRHLQSQKSTETPKGSVTAYSLHSNGNLVSANPEEVEDITEPEEVADED